MSGYKIGDFAVGRRVFAFHPQALGVCHWATVTKVGRTHLHVEWHVTGRGSRIKPSDVLREEGE
jgi:hypothetical protein